MTAQRALLWWRDEPADVRRVLAVAALRQGADDPVHDEAISGYTPQAQALFLAIGDDLALAEQLDAGDEDTLRALLGDDDAWHGALYDHRDSAFTRERDRLRARALDSARELIRSVRSLPLVRAS